MAVAMLSVVALLPLVQAALLASSSNLVAAALSLAANAQNEASSFARRQSLDPPYTGYSREGNDLCHVVGAAKYIRAVITHQLSDAKAIPTTDDVTRDEGPPGLLIRTANSRHELIVSSVIGPQALFGGPLYEHKEPVYEVLNSTAILATYTINAGLLNGTIPLTTSKIDETFVYPHTQACAISHIQAVIYVGEK